MRLVGVKANRSAVGAKIKVTVKDPAGVTREVYRTVGSGGSFGASPIEQHLGLGKAATLVSLEIQWPGGGTQRFSTLAVNEAIESKQDSPEVRKRVVKPVRLGGKGGQ